MQRKHRVAQAKRMIIIIITRMSRTELRMDIYSALMQNACIESGYDNRNSILSTAHMNL